MYELLGICLVLATLLTINALASLLVAGCWPWLELPLRKVSARTRAEILFGLRVSPPVIALIAVSFFLVPSYIGYEPYATAEIVSKKLGVLALLSGAGVLFALWRGCRSWFATHSLLHRWLASAERITLNGVSIPTFSIPHRFPVIAVVGTLRPKLFVAERVLESLSPDELMAAIAHERGHLGARDNLRRSLLRLCRDMLTIVPCGRSLDRAWAEAAECAADEAAAQENEAIALNLASALVKIARMVPAGMLASMPLASYLIGAEESRGIKVRIRRLLEIATSDRRVHGRPRALAGILPLSCLSLLVVLGTLVVIKPSVLFTVHEVVERAVALLC